MTVEQVDGSTWREVVFSCAAVIAACLSMRRAARLKRSSGGDRYQAPARANRLTHDGLKPRPEAETSKCWKIAKRLKGRTKHYGHMRRLTLHARATRWNRLHESAAPTVGGIGADGLVQKERRAKEALATAERGERVREVRW